MKINKITYVGWLGYGNLGDEALFEANKKVFHQYELSPSLDHPLSRITLFGGGTLLPHWGLTVLPNRYNYAYGLGVRNPIFWGNYHQFVIDLVKRFCFRYIGVRDNRSHRLLKEWGINSEVIGDPCLLLKPKSGIRRKEDLIGLNFCATDGSLWGHDDKRVMQEAIELCRHIKSKGYNAVLIPFSKSDIEYVTRISKLSGADIFEEWMDIQEVIDFIGSCSVCIGERLHSIVLSASAYTPFISLEYRPKCRAFSELMGFSGYTIRTDEMSSRRVIDLFDELLLNWDRMQSNLVANVEVYREKLGEAATKITSDIESLPDDKWSHPSLFQNRMRRILYGTDIYFYNHVNGVWQAWYRTPAKRPVEHLWEFLRRRSMGTSYGPHKEPYR